MCGRYALGININDLPAKLGDIYSSQVDVSEATHPESNASGGSEDTELHHLGAEESPEYSDRSEIQATEGESNSQLENQAATDTSSSDTLSVLVSPGYDVSYNIPPTGTGVIIYQQGAQSFVIEPSKFGVLPVWAKPTPDSKNSLRQEVQRHQAKYFNCRRETLEKSQSVWTSMRSHHRCVVPISGYYEWLHSGKDKTPYYVTSKTSETLFLAGLYCHNVNFNGTELVSQPWFSSFSVVTGPSHGSGSNDLSWLHSRKPIFLQPGTSEWSRWLNPDQQWGESVLKCLDTDNNPAYDDLVWHQVSSSVGNLRNKGPEVKEEVKLKQPRIMSFFGNRSKQEASVKTEREGVKRETKEEEIAKAEENIKKESKRNLETAEDSTGTKRIKTENSHA